MPKCLGQTGTGDWRWAKKKTGSKKGQGWALEKRLCLLSKWKAGYPHTKPLAAGTFTGRPARTMGMVSYTIQDSGSLHREACRVVELHEGFLHWSYRSPGK